MTHSARDVYASFLEARERGGDLDLEDLCARHGELAEELRRLHADERFLAGMLHPVGGPLPRDSSAALLIERLARRGDALERYRTDGEVARGGQGVVLRVWDRDLERSLAMKTLRAGSERGHGERLTRFLSEARLASRLDHPNILPVHEVGFDPALGFFFTMKLVQGRDLRGIFELVHKEMEGWSLTRALGVLLRVCDAMAFAHDRGVIHRDLKPANVMVGRFGEVYVMDWGLARAVDLEGASQAAGSSDPVGSDRRAVSLTQQGAVLGTPAYMPPEQARGERESVDKRSDVYAMGAMLYHLLAGAMPYAGSGSGKDSRDVLARVVAGPPEPLVRCAPRANAELVAICEKAMARSPRNRYADMGELGEDLQAFLEDRTVRAHRVGAGTELIKWMRRNRTMACAVGGGLALAFAGLATAIFVQVRANERFARNLQETRRGAYLTGVLAAGMNIALENTPEALRQLRACPSEHRAWEWHYLSRLADRSVRVLHDHGSVVSALAVDPSGRRLASGAFDGTIKIWSAGEDTEVSIVDTGPDYALELAFLEGGELLLTGSKLGKVTARDLGGRELWSFQVGAPLVDLAVGSAGDGVAAVDQDGRLLLWVDGTSIEAADDVTAAAFHPRDGRMACGGMDGAVFLLEQADGSPRRRLGEIQGRITAIAFHPQGRGVAAASDGGNVRFFFLDAASPAIELAGHSRAVVGLAFDQEGSKLASASWDGTLLVWRIEGDDFADPTVLRGHAAEVSAVVLLPGSNELVSGSWDGTVRSWDVDAPGPELVLSAHEDWVEGIAVDPGGRWIASASADRTVRLWDVETGSPLGTLRGHESFVDDIAASPDGTLLATASADGTAGVWNARTGALLHQLRHPSRVRAVAFDPGGMAVATAADDGRARIWDLREAVLAASIDAHAETVFDLAYAPDGRLATASFDGLARIWDPASGSCLLTLEGHEGRLYAIAFDPEGRRLATGSWDRTARIWDARDGSPLSVLRGHDGSVLSVAFSPDGSRLVSTSFDLAVRLWDPMTGDLAAVLRGHRELVESARFTPDGGRIVSGGHDRTIRVWDGRPR